MEKLYLGSRFVRIMGEHEEIFTDCGTGNCTIYCPESIYYTSNTFVIYSYYEEYYDSSNIDEILINYYKGEIICYY